MLDLPTSQSDGEASTRRQSHDIQGSTEMFDPSEGYNELKRREINDEQDKKELGFDDWSSSHTTAAADSYPGLSMQDKKSFALLVTLYLLQGIPVGLASGSIPFLLKSKLSYGQIGIFSLASYPYSLKLLWSPIVDATYSKSIGRRKSWIIPIQILMGSLLLWLGLHIDEMFTNEKLDVTTLTFLFFTLIFLSATQDIAVDGWALTLLSKPNLSYASTAQTVGLNTGYFLSFTVLLAFHSAEFSNKYFRSEPKDEGILQLGTYLVFWAFVYFAVTIWLIFGKAEERTQHDDDMMDVKSVYTTIWNICKLPHMKNFILVMLLAKIGFIANENVTGLKLLEKGFNREDLALTVLIDFPFQIIFGYYAAKWSSGPQPLNPWLKAFYGRLAFAVTGMLIILAFPKDGVVSTGYFFLVIASTVFNSFMSTVQFVSISAFFTTIADPVIGGTYMTLLATFSNFGGTWPRFFVLGAVDYFTEATCSVPDADNTVLNCVGEQEKAMCKDNGGICTIERDGYYVVSMICIILGALTLFGFVRPQVKNLQRLEVKKWSLYGHRSRRGS
ncbi:5879_t:CDS:10 [Paraglomus occultum]|uniref:5879_t:CDS:1 n=1 Tax=Paraglomus occultum TaxID=144539 RepID=A0A9N9FKR9_9GLOM|nr:5879_t:CDS:10 [Paraglomus occultum]